MPHRIDTPGASEDNQTVDGLQMPLVANGPPLAVGGAHGCCSIPTDICPTSL